MCTPITSALERYSRSVNVAVDQYCEQVTLIARDSKYLSMLRENSSRLQGSLTFLGYELCGGTDTKMIERAALAIELFHAYVQCLEQDIDTTQALRGQHEAAIIMATLETDPEYRIKALGITSRTLMLANMARLDNTSEDDKLQWRATELTLNPIHVGQVLAGSNCDANNAVTPLATRIGTQLVRGENVDIENFFTELRTITW